MSYGVAGIGIDLTACTMPPVDEEGISLCFLPARFRSAEM